MGGDHHGHHLPKVPDWRIYKIEDCPDLVRTQRALASIGLKDPWLRNEVWRYDRKIWGTRTERFMTFMFRGFKWGLLAAIVTASLEKYVNSGHDHGHGHGHEAEHGHH